MNHKLPELPFAPDALVPVISQKTIEFHYGKHHQAYVTNLNKLIGGTDFETMPLEEIVRKSDGGIFNNAAQVWNHTFFWNCLRPKGGDGPKGKLLEALNQEFGSLDGFRDAFSKAAATLFGSGWAWLVSDPSGALSILQESNAGTPLTRGLKPLLTFDVWEHAYYLDFQNRRPDFIQSLWDIVDWEKVGSRY
jgi:superoxide dismutase, Fe-Mn family